MSVEHMVLSFPFSRCSHVAVVFRSVSYMSVCACVCVCVILDPTRSLVAYCYHDIYCVFSCKGFCVCVRYLPRKCDILITSCHAEIQNVSL